MSVEWNRPTNQLAMPSRCFKAVNLSNSMQLINMKKPIESRQVKCKLVIVNILRFYKKKKSFTRYRSLTFILHKIVIYSWTITCTEWTHCLNNDNWIFFTTWDGTTTGAGLRGQHLRLKIIICYITRECISLCRFITCTLFVKPFSIVFRLLSVNSLCQHLLYIE